MTNATYSASHCIFASLIVNDAIHWRAVELVEQHAQDDEPSSVDELPLGRTEDGHDPHQPREGGNGVRHHIAPARNAPIRVLDHR